MTRISLIIAAALFIAGCAGGDRLEDGDPQKLSERAHRQLQNGDWEGALRTLERLETRYPFTDWAKQAQLDQIYAFYRAELIEAADDAADRFIRENPRYPDVDYAYYLKGLIFFPPDAGPLERIFNADISMRPADSAERSFNNFKRLVEIHPESEYAPEARQRMIFLRNRIAQFELHVADYYLRRGAWLAAANRARTVVEEMPRTPQVEQALAVMAYSYGQLGLTEQAADAERVLGENYGLASLESLRKKEYEDTGRKFLLF